MRNIYSRLKHLFLTICLLTLSYFAMAQRNVTGRISTDDSNVPLAGATIFNKATNKTSVTDANGTFVIDAIGR